MITSWIRLLCLFTIMTYILSLYFLVVLQPKHSFAKLLKISWEDPTLKQIEAHRVGPGEQGEAVVLNASENAIAFRYNNQNGFNIYISDKISIERAVPDIRHPLCKTMEYRSVLPSVSVVIPFFEEHWSTLLRTFTSVLKRSPPSLVKEIILVDDGSRDRKFLKEKLDQYLSERHPDGKVRVIRLNEREGLIQARIQGAKAATGEILVFLDSHCEPIHNWLPPLIEPIAENYRTVTCPLIDTIKADTFKYVAQDEGKRGIFNWHFGYNKVDRLPEDLKHPELPFFSPVMAGGLFAISRKWFWELGGYDPELYIWGGEQYELSFKVWMCGGKMLDVPCSRVGHVFRKTPTNFPNMGNFLLRNYRRVADVWMDEYREYLFMRNPDLRTVDPGNLDEQQAVRKRLNCKNFKWFLSEVAPDLLKVYPTIEPEPEASGRLRSQKIASWCVDASYASENTGVQLKPCNDKYFQKFDYSFHHDIRIANKNRCFDAFDLTKITLFECHVQGGNQHWRIESIKNDGRNPTKVIQPYRNKCLDVDLSTNIVKLNQCSEQSETQQWIWDSLKLNSSKL